MLSVKKKNPTSNYYSDQRAMVACKNCGMRQ